MAVAIYLRVSTEEQRERQSILTQREFGERYCALHSLATFRIYADDGVSGTVPLERRPQGSQILIDARRGQFSQLLIYKLDRLGRETRLILNAVAELEKLGVRVRSMTEEFDTGSATGRLMLTMLSGFAAHERDMIKERSVAGTVRMAETGAWLGGIVPYGYRKSGEKRDARLVVSNDPIPGMTMSEADVMRDIYHLAAVERKSCRVIAERLNELHVPCSYVRDDRLLLRGKRKQRTSGLWRAGRVRNMIINKTYMGVHEYGKRGKLKMISRQVPALVTEDIWLKAQTNLKGYQFCSKQNAHHKYLLRGLMKCTLCGLTYVGTTSSRPNAKPEFYYRCNGVHSGLGHHCTSKAVRGELLEDQVWADVEQFLRNPGDVLMELQKRLEADSKDTHGLVERQRQIEDLIEQKTIERNRVVSLYRRGRLTDADLDQQMGEIDQEEVGLRTQSEEILAKLQGSMAIGASVSSAESLLARLRQRLDEPVSFELKRQLIEVLVSNIRVETLEIGGVRQNKISVTYRFSLPGEAALLLAPRSLPSMLRRHEPITVGDHLRKKRLSLKLLQQQVAEDLGVTKASIGNWEIGITQPMCQHLPAIIRFLGYNPLPPATTIAARLIRCRTSLGLSRQQAADRLAVDQGTLGRWERGEREPAGALASRVQSFLEESGTHEAINRQHVSDVPEALRIAS